MVPGMVPLPAHLYLSGNTAAPKASPVAKANEIEELGQQKDFFLGLLKSDQAIQLAEVLVTREMLTGILERIGRLRLTPG